MTLETPTDYFPIQGKKRIQDYNSRMEWEECIRGRQYIKLFENILNQVTKQVIAKAICLNEKRLGKYYNYLQKVAHMQLV